MTRYIGRRLLASIPTLILISMVVFGILGLASGDPLGQFAANPDTPAEHPAPARPGSAGPDPLREVNLPKRSGEVHGALFDAIVRGDNERARRFRSRNLLITERLHVVHLGTTHQIRLQQKGAERKARQLKRG